MNPTESQILTEALDPISADMERRAKRRLLSLHVATWAAPYVLALLLFLALYITIRFFPDAPLQILNHSTYPIAMVLGPLAAAGVFIYCGFLHAVLRCKRSGREPERRSKQVAYDTIAYVLLQATVICVVIPTVIELLPRHH